jgi:hypothetical protein
MMDFPKGDLEPSGLLIARFKNEGIVKEGETILLVHGSVWKKPGLTNTLSVIEIQ